MRTSKFRIWDKYEEEFLNPEDFAINFVGTLFEANLEEDCYEVLDRGRYIIYEFSGCLDKRNTEIYEGDILKDYDNDLIGIVCFEKGAFMVICDNELIDIYDWTGECVIGNIQEDFELIESVKGENK